MFLNTNKISVEILSSHELKWKKRDAVSDFRPFHALSFRILGDARFIHKDDICTAKSGDIVFVPNLYQYSLHTGDEYLFVIHFTSNQSLPNKIKTFSPDNPAYYEMRFKEFYSRWKRKQTGYEYECKSIFFRILMHIERDIEYQKFREKPDKLSEAVDYIHEHFTDSELSVHHLANLCGMSDTYFRKLFLSRFAVTPHIFINNLKLQYAMELLKSKYYTVSETAAKCGFENIYYFSSFIKKRTGKSPSELMKNN